MNDRAKPTHPIRTTPPSPGNTAARVELTDRLAHWQADTTPPSPGNVAARVEALLPLAEREHREAADHEQTLIAQGVVEGITRALGAVHQPDPGPHWMVTATAEAVVTGCRDLMGTLQALESHMAASRYATGEEPVTDDVVECMSTGERWRLIKDSPIYGLVIVGDHRGRRDVHCYDLRLLERRRRPVGTVQS